MPPRHARDPDAVALADRLHSAAIHLLRRVRRADDAAGLSAPQLSALSVLVFGGPRTLGELAAAEQVRPPTMTRLVATLEAAGLVTRERDPGDARVSRVRATPRAERILEQGRTRRIEVLARAVAELPARDRAALRRGADVLERLVGPPSPHRT